MKKDNAKPINTAFMVRAVVLLAVVLICLWYIKVYPIQPNMKNLEQILLSEAESHHAPAAPLTLQDSVTLGDITYQLAEVGPEQKLMLFPIRRGPFTRYAIAGMMASSSEWYGGVITVKDDAYLLIGGRNPDRMLAQIECSWEDGPSCTLNLPDSSTFLVSALLNPAPDTQNLNLQHIRFLDATGQDVTDTIQKDGWSIGSIQ